MTYVLAFNHSFSNQLLTFGPPFVWLLDLLLAFCMLFFFFWLYPSDIDLFIGLESQTVLLIWKNGSNWLFGLQLLYLRSESYMYIHFYFYIFIIIRFPTKHKYVCSLRINMHLWFSVKNLLLKEKGKRKGVKETRDKAVKLKELQKSSVSWLVNRTLKMVELRKLNWQPCNEWKI